MTRKVGGFKMAGAIMEKVWGLFGMDPAEDKEEEIEDYEGEEEENEEEAEERRLFGRRDRKSVV